MKKINFKYTFRIVDDDWLYALTHNFRTLPSTSASSSNLHIISLLKHVMSTTK